MPTNDKKVEIKVYYTSMTGMMFAKDFACDTMEEAKIMVEENMPEWGKSEVRMESSIRHDGGMEYDVTIIAMYRFSHVEITDYTDGREIPADQDK
jgi:hypothetical protein